MLNRFNSEKVFFKTSVPFISSDPMFRSDTKGFCSGKIDLYKAAPISEKSIKFFSLHSILAPKSKTTLIPFWLGHKPANAGLLTSFIIFKIIFEITKRTPVLPADKLISASPSTWALIEFHILVFFEFFIAVKGVSSSDTTPSVCINCMISLLIFCFDSSSAKSFLSPYNWIIKSLLDLFFLKNIPKPSMFFFGAFSPPIASIAIVIFFFIFFD